MGADEDIEADEASMGLLLELRTIPLFKAVGAESLVPIAAKPKAESRGNKKGEHDFTLRPRELSAGRYRVVCRVRDTTEIRGEKLPWVLEDEWGLLESERMWLVQVGP